MKLEKVIDPSILEKLSDSEIDSLTESIVKYADKKTDSIEKELSSKFESMVDNIGTKFDGMLTETLNESANTQLNEGVNNELFNALESIVNILESSGVYVSEETKKSRAKVVESNKKLKEAKDASDRNIEELKKGKTRDYIFGQLMGSEQKLIQAAQDHFKGKDIETVIDELDDFVNGNFANIDMDEEYTDGLEDLDLDELESSLGQLDNGGMFESTDSVNAIKVKGGKNMVSITDDILEQSLVESANNTTLNDETREAMDAINSMQNLGYGINPTI
jgi:uncharacterized membrane protein YheB (UPF0754 family)